MEKYRYLSNNIDRMCLWGNPKIPENFNSYEFLYHVSCSNIILICDIFLQKN